MNGIVLRKAKCVNEDERRAIFELMNGELAVKNMKVLFVKKGEQLLGNHSHVYSEIMYILKGSAKYRMKNLDTGEVEDYNLVEGDTIIRTGRIVHAGIFAEDSIIIDGAESTYINGDFNDVREIILEKE